MSKSYKNNNSGFTIIEMLIAMAIFVTAITSVSAIFTFTNKTQRVTKATQKTQADARFAMEVMAQQVRRGSIDYNATPYGDTIASNPQDVLVLRDSSDNEIWFQRRDFSGRFVVAMSEDGSTWVDLTPPDISVDILKFYLSPSTDPFSSNPSTNNQPQVTIVMRTSNTSTEGQGLFPIFMQTTVSSRQYVR
jgi:prepilin-type N-terminal cleavage/methylation domain-containing protein